tara:strand:- start:4723 stop:6480 length:1758 start_codon:yes stop_codon:yes gene_type:complete
MADEIKDNIEESGYTNFGGSENRAGSYYTPTGPIGRFFAKFFATKAQLPAAASIDGKVAPETGDTVVSTQVIKDSPAPDGPAVGGISRNPILPQLELNRRRRYKDYEEMDEYPEIGAAFDIYSDDSTQRGLQGQRWAVKSNDDMIVDEVESFFDQIRLDKLLWDIIRNTVKYGDCFTELILDVNKPQEGIKKIKILNPNYILRVENEFGYLKKFLQEIPNMETMQYAEVGQSNVNRPVKYIELDKNQIVHFRLHTSDPIFYPYGKSIAALCHRVFRSLKMMEDAMMIYRLSRAPERRIFYVDTGNLPTSKAEMFIERLKQKFKKEKFYNTPKGTVDSRYNPMSMDEDFFVPTKNGRGTKIDTLPGATNLGEIEDVRYYRDKLLAGLKIPKDYVVEKDQSPERKANLSQLDVKFARTIQRVQIDVETGLENMAKRHLQLRGYPASMIKNLKIKLPEPSDMSEKRKLDVNEQKTRVVQAVQGLNLFSKEKIYKEFYDMTDDEIRRIKSEIDQEQQNDQGAAGAGPGPGEAGGQESAENTPPTANESVDYALKFVAESTNDEKTKEIMQRIIEKQQQKQTVVNTEESI